MTDSEHTGGGAGSRGVGGLVAILVFVFLSSLSEGVEAKALASAILNIESLVWYKYDGVGPIDPGAGDTPLYAYSATDTIKVGDLSLSPSGVQPPYNDSASIRADNSLGMPSEVSNTRGLDQVQTPLDLPNQCSGPGCNLASNVPYQNNNFTTLPPAPDAITQNYAYIDQNLVNAAFGFGVNKNGVKVTNPGAQIGLRAEVSLPYLSSGTTDSNTQSYALESSTSVTSPVTIFTYFAVTYSLNAVAALDWPEASSALSYAEATWNFSIQASGLNFSPQELNSSVFGVPGSAPDLINASRTIYSTDGRLATMYRLPPNLARNLTLSVGVTATGTATSPLNAVPVPATLILVATGGLIGAALRRRPVRPL